MDRPQAAQFDRLDAENDPYVIESITGFIAKFGTTRTRNAHP